MKVTKLGHCCLLIEEKGVRILTDPGAWTQEQNDLQNIDVLLITHEHQDHFHIASVKQILGNNPEVRIFCNQSVGKLLAEQEVKFELLGHGQSTVVKDISLEGMGQDHARIYEQYGQVENTGYFIANRLFYPGDSFFNPQKADLFTTWSRILWSRMMSNLLIQTKITHLKSNDAIY